MGADDHGTLHVYARTALGGEETMVAQSEREVRSHFHLGAGKDFLALPNARNERIAGFGLNASMKQGIDELLTKRLVLVGRHAGAAGRPAHRNKNPIARGNDRVSPR